MNDDRAAHEMHARRGGGQLQDQAFESHGVVVAHHALVFGRQQQVKFDSPNGRKGALGLGRGDGEAAIEVRHKDLLQVAVGVRVAGDAVQPQFLWQAALDGLKGAFAAPAGLGRAGQDVSDAQGPQRLCDLALLLLGRRLAGLLGAAEVEPRSVYNSQKRP